MTKAHAYPSVLLRNVKEKNMIAERPSGQSLAVNRGLGASLAT
jgi:hypothetical protein